MTRTLAAGSAALALPFGAAACGGDAVLEPDETLDGSNAFGRRRDDDHSVMRLVLGLR